MRVPFPLGISDVVLAWKLQFLGEKKICIFDKVQENHCDFKDLKIYACTLYSLYFCMDVCMIKAVYVYTYIVARYFVRNITKKNLS